MVITSFQIKDKSKKIRYFQEILLIADNRMDIVFEMPFLTFNNIDIRFAEGDFTWRIYMAKKALPSIKRVQIINLKKFAKAALDPNQEVFIICVATIILEINIYLVC